MQAIVDTILGNAKEALKTVSREAFNNTIKWINGVSAVVVSIIPGAGDGSTWSSFTHPTMPRWMETGVSDFNRMVSEFTHSDQNLLSESGSESGSDDDSTASFFSHHHSRNGLFRRSRRFISGMFGRSPHSRRENGHSNPLSPIASEQGSTHPSRRNSAAGGSLPKSGSENSLSRRMSDVWHSAFPFSERNRSAQKGLLEELQFQLERAIDWGFELVRGATYYVLSPSEGLRFIFWRIQGLGRTQSASQTAREEEHKVTTVEQIITDAGYPYEAHRVVTEDGYILRLERIPRKESRRAVILQHGLLDSSLGWVANGVVGSQAFAAYDQGYDVWLGNFRGYTSREHVNPNISKRDYWDYTVLEHSQYDVGGMIQRIDDVKTAELPPISPRSSYHSATTQPSTPNALEDLPEPSPHSLHGINVSFGEEDAALQTQPHPIPDHLIPDAASEGSRKDVLSSPGGSRRSSLDLHPALPGKSGRGAESEAEANGRHTRDPSRVSSYADADDGAFSDIEEEIPPYTLSGIAHSLGGMALIVYVILRRIEGKPHRLARLILLSPAGYHEKTPFLLDILQWFAPAVTPFMMRFCPGFYIPTRLLRHVFGKLVQDFQSLPALRALAQVLIRTFILGGDDSNWIDALELPHYSAQNMPGIAFMVASHLRQCKWYKRFQLFDYGRAKNLRRYGTAAPLNIGAHYNLIDIPVDLVVGTKDGLIPAEMIYKHYNNMRRNGVEVSIKEFAFAHLDFTFENKQELMSYVMSRLALGSSAEAHTPAARLRSIVQGERVAERIASARLEDKASVTGARSERRISQTSSILSSELDDFFSEGRRDRPANGHVSTNGDVSNGRRCVSLGGAGTRIELDGGSGARRAPGEPRRSSDGGAVLREQRKELKQSKSKKERKKKEYEALSFEQLMAASDEEMEGVVQVDAERMLRELLGHRDGGEERRDDGRPLSWPDQGARSPSKGGAVRRASRQST